jgi:HAD superfamily hydrolase (TIGR01459 family)
MAPAYLDDMAPLVDRFDLFLVDQFGVLHDGRRPYAGAAAALAGLTACGKSAVVLTNSAKRNAPNEARLLALGFARSSFLSVMSSGEVLWCGLRDGRFGASFSTGRRIFVVGHADDDYGFERLGLDLVAAPERADAIIIAGSDAPRVSLAQYREMLAPPASRGVPALCGNPDMTMLRDGGLHPAPGAIAAVYRELGGLVTHVGKPHAAIYEAALSLVPGIDTSRCIVFGDSIEHDVSGGKRAGLATALVRTGILADVAEEELPRLFDRHGALPDFILPGFRWR